MSDTINIIKLVSGEELIASIEDHMNDDVITAKKVHSINVVPTNDGQYGLSLFPFLKGAPDSPIKINKSTIITCVEAPDDLARVYLSQTTGITLASSVLS